MEKKELAERLYKAVGGQIAQLRHAARPALTQERLADLAQLSRSAIANIERGRQRVSLHHLYLIAEALGVNPAELLPPPVEQAADQLRDPKERAWISKIARKRLPRATEEDDAKAATD